MSDKQELVDYLVSKGHSQERAEQIAGNHPEAVRKEMAESQVDDRAANAGETADNGSEAD